MNQLWEKVEKINTFLIPFAVIALLIILILELFFHPESETAHLIIEITDWIIVTIFVIDLIFLGIKAKSTRYFFKHYWLDIIAVLPFVLLFRFFSRFYLLVVGAEEFKLGQSILHESLEVGKVASKSEKLTKIGKGIRVGARLIRVATKSSSLRFKRKNIKHVRV
jgi:uncharacterized membrane protein